MMSATQTRPAPQRSRAAHSHVSGAERQIARAQEDYRRLRSAYLQLAKAEAGEVALAMVGADMDRAHAALQDLSGLRQLPFTHDPVPLPQREAERAEEHA